MLRRITSQSKLTAIIGFVIVIGLNGIFTLSAYGHGGKPMGRRLSQLFKLLKKPPNSMTV